MELEICLRLILQIYRADGAKDNEALCRCTTRFCFSSKRHSGVAPGWYELGLWPKEQRTVPNGFSSSRWRHSSARPHGHGLAPVAPGSAHGARPDPVLCRRADHKSRASDAAAVWPAVHARGGSTAPHRSPSGRAGCGDGPSPRQFMGVWQPAQFEAVGMLHGLAAMLAMRKKAR
jgi:hypothetical protein